MQRILILTCTALLLAASSAAAAGRDLTSPPSDTAEARRVRIWLSVQQPTTRTRALLTIRNDSNRVVRTLIDGLQSNGYFNYYWDKRDDSGLWVPPGSYHYDMSIAGSHQYGELEAVYLPGERECSVAPKEGSFPQSISFTLSRDSLPVTIRIRDFADRVLATPVYDSLFSAGEHRYDWKPGPGVLHGQYRLELKVGEAEFVDTVWCTR